MRPWFARLPWFLLCLWALPVIAQSPTGFNVATGVGQTALFWDPYPSAAGYRIYWSTSPNPYPSGSVINTGSQHLSYVHTGLTAGTTYYYQVCALINPGPAESTPTAALSAVVLTGNYFAGGNADGHAMAGNCPSKLMGTIYPIQATGLTAAPLPGQVSLYWNEVAGATSYTIERSTTSGSGFTTLTTGSLNPTAVDATPIAGTTYYYRVLVNLAGGCSGVVSAEVSATPTAQNLFAGGNGDGYAQAGNCPSKLMGTIYPIQATGLIAAALPGQVSLYWNEVSGATGYTVERSTTSGSGFTTLTSGSLNPTAVDATPVAGTTYYYRVLVNLAGGCSGVVSSEITATPLAQNLYAGGNGDGHTFIASCVVKLNGAANAPGVTAVRVAAGPNSASINWDDLSGSGGYGLEFSTVSNTGPWTQIYSGGNLSAFHNGLVSGTTYYYRVVASLGGGCTASPSPVLTAIPVASNFYAGGNADGYGQGNTCILKLNGVSNAPGVAAVRVSAGPGSNAINWDDLSGASGYSLEFSTTSNTGPWTSIYSGGNLSQFHNGLAAGTTYYYRVVASLGGGCAASPSPVTSAVPVAQNFFSGGNGDGNAYAYTCLGKLTGTAVFSSVQNLTAAAMPGAISLYWNGIDPATSYLLEWTTTPGFNYVTIGTGSNNTSFVHTSPSPAMNYYRLTPVLGLGCTAAIGALVSTRPIVQDYYSGGNGDGNVFASSCFSTKLNNTSAPVITALGPIDFCAPGQVTLVATGGNSAYSWSPGGQTTQSITVSSTGLYRVSTTNNFCTLTSPSVAVNAYSTTSATLSGAQTICSGDTARITFNLTGGAPYSLVYSNGSQQATVTGINSHVYQFTVIPSQSATYTAVSLTSLCGSGAGIGQQVVTVNPSPTVVMSGTSNLCSGGSTQLTFQFTGTSPWNVMYSDGISTFSAGNVSANPYLVSISPTVNRIYTPTLVFAGCSGTVSGSQTVQVVSSPSAAISGTQTICNGTNAGLQVNFTGNAPWDFQYNDGVSTIPVNGVTANPYTLSVSPSVNRTYTLVSVLSGCSGSVSGSATVGVLPAPSATISGNSTINLGQTSTLSVQFTGQSPWQIAYSDGTSSYSASGITASPYVLTISPQQTATYQLISVQDNNCLGTVSGSGVIVVNALPSAILSGAQTICRTQSTTLTLQLGGPSPWTVTYTDGQANYTMSGLTATPYVFTVTPSQTATYTLVSVVNPYVGTVSGSANVWVDTIPSAPGLLSGTQPTCSGVTLNWSGVNDATGYFLDVSLDSLFTTYLSGYQNQNMGTSTQAVVTGLTAGQTVYFQVRSVGTCGTSGSSVRGQGTTLPLPGTVVSQGATQVNCSSFVANWNVNNNASDYRLDVSTDTLFTSYVPNYQNVLTGNTTSYSVTGLSAGQGYYYRVRGENSCGVSPINSTRSGIVTYNLGDSIQISGTSVICSGSSLSLTGSSSIVGTMMQWSGPNGYTQTLNQVQLSRNNMVVGDSGVYSLTVSYTGCSTAVLTQSVVVNTPITSINLGGNSPLCSGEILNLTSNGGTQGSVYSWQGPNGYSSQHQNPQIYSITAQDSGLYSLTVTSPGCNSIIDSVHISVIPTAPITVSNNTPICEGGTVYLQATFVGGSQYQWNGPNGYSTTQLNPFFTQAQPMLSGVYTLTVIQTGCNPLIYLSNVTVSPALSQLNPTSNTPVCSGDTLRMQVTNLPGTTYSWSGPNGFTAGNVSQIRISNSQVNQAGNYTIYANLPGCGAYEYVYGIQIGQRVSGHQAMVSNSAVCEGSSFNLSAGMINGSSYQWQGPAGFSANTNAPAIQSAQLNNAGVYSLSIQSLGCPIYQDTVQVIIGRNPQQVTSGTNSPICVGGLLILSSSQVNGLTYAWNGPNNYSSTSSTDTITNVTQQSGGPYALSVSSPGCATYSVGYRVSVNNPGQLSASSNSPVCSGGTLQLSTRTVGGVTYRWDGPNGFSSTLITPSLVNVQANQTGVYSLVITYPNCGAYSFTTSVQVGNDVSQISIGNNGPICTGNILQLSSTLFSGVTYNWTGPNGFTSSNALDSIVNTTTSNAGLYSVQLISPGCPMATRTMNVTVNPALSLTSSSNSPVCQGGFLYMSVSPSTGVSYTWSGPNGYSGTGATPSITNAQPNQSGTYIITGTQPGCGTASTTLSVTIGTNVTRSLVASSNSPICTGQTLRLSSTQYNNVSYRWSGPNGFSSALMNDTLANVTNVSAGEYTVSVNSPGCPLVSQTTNVGVNTAPVVSFTSNSPVCQGGTLQLSTASITGATYRWDGPNNFSSTQQTPAFVNAQTNQSGVYILAVSIPSCGTISSQQTLTVSPDFTGISYGTSSPVCSGQTLRLSVTQRSGYSSYSWTGPNGYTGSLAQDSVSPVVLASAGAYTISITSPGCGTGTWVTSPVSVTSVSNLNASGNTPICQGGILYLSSGQMTGATYVWSGPQNFVSTLRTPALSNVAANQSGTYTLSVNVPGCGLVSSTTSITIGSNFTGLSARTNSPVCAGGSLRVSVNQLRQNHSYVWNGPASYSSTIGRDTISPVSLSMRGVYTLTITSPGCGTNVLTTSNVQVGNGSLVTANGNNPVCTNGTLNLVSPVVAGVGRYVWRGPGSWQFNGRTATRYGMQLSQGGVYSVTASVPGCGTVTSTVTINVVNCKSVVTATTDSISGAGNSSDLNLNLNPAIVGQTILTAWPNPNEGTEVNLKWEGLTATDATITVKVYDAQGKLVYVKSVKRGDETPMWTETVAFGQVLSQGQYVIETVHEGSRQYVKMMVE